METHEMLMKIKILTKSSNNVVIRSSSYFLFSVQQKNSYFIGLHFVGNIAFVFEKNVMISYLKPPEASKWLHIVPSSLNFILNKFQCICWNLDQRKFRVKDWEGSLHANNIGFLLYRASLSKIFKRTVSLLGKVFLLLGLSLWNFIYICKNEF